MRIARERWNNPSHFYDWSWFEYLLNSYYEENGRFGCIVFFYRCLKYNRSISGHESNTILREQLRACQIIYTTTCTPNHTDGLDTNCVDVCIRCLWTKTALYYVWPFGLFPWNLFYFFFGVFFFHCVDCLFVRGFEFPSKIIICFFFQLNTFLYINAFQT